MRKSEGGDRAIRSETDGKLIPRFHRTPPGYLSLCMPLYSRVKRRRIDAGDAVQGIARSDEKPLGRWGPLGIKKVGWYFCKFHDLRHDRQHVNDGGVPQRSVMEILGHKDRRETV